MISNLIETTSTIHRSTTAGETSWLTFALATTSKTTLHTTVAEMELVIALACKKLLRKAKKFSYRPFKR